MEEELLAPESNGEELGCAAAIESPRESRTTENPRLSPVPSQPAADSGASSRFFLGIFDDHLRGQPVTDGTLLIGRSKGNHLQLHDHLLSRKHCSLSLSGERLTLVDLNSSNGTYVNGERIGTRELAMDDIIELGKTVMVVYDGSSWGRGEGLMDLRNPLKAQELIHSLHDERILPAGPGDERQRTRNGVRARKGLTESERAFLRWLERGETRLLPGLVTDYLTHKLVSLLVRNSKPVRSAFTTVLEEMMRPQFFQRFGSIEELRQGIEEIVEQELNDLREEPEESPDRGLLEIEPPVANGEEAKGGGPAGDPTPPAPDPEEASDGE